MYYSLGGLQLPFWATDLVAGVRSTFESCKEAPKVRETELHTTIFQYLYFIL